MEAQIIISKITISEERPRVGRTLDTLGSGMAARVDYYRMGVIDDPHSFVDRNLILWWSPGLDGGSNYVLGPNAEGLIVVHNLQAHACKILEVLGQVTISIKPEEED